MKALTILQMALFVIATVLALLSDFSKVKSGGKVTVWGLVTIVAIIFTLGLSILLEKIKSDNENEKDRIEKERYESIIARSNETLNKADLTLQKQDQTLQTSLEALEKAGIIIDSLNDNLVLQRDLNRAATDLLEKNQKLLEQQQLELDNAERILNPVYPFHFFIQYAVLFKEPDIAKLVEYLTNLKNNFTKDPNFKIQGIKVGRRPGTHEIAQLVIENYEDVIPHFDSLYKYDKQFSFGFVHEKHPFAYERLDYSKSIAVYRPKYRKNEINNSYRKRISRLKVSFEEKSIEFATYFTEISTFAYLDKTNQNFGIRD